MNRREFLKGSMVTLLAIPLVGCSSDDDPTGTGGSTGGCQGTSATGSSSSGHTHTLCVPEGDLTNPPSGGKTYTTSVSGHTHMVTLSQSDLVTINGGSSVTVGSLSDSTGHEHSFTIQKA